MKRTFLKFLPIAAAVLLATSCSKDNDGDNNVVNNPTGRDDVHIVSTTSESNAVPFSIKVVTGNSLSKIGYADNGSVTPEFQNTDVNTLKMTIKNGETSLGELTLTNVDGTFEGQLEPEPADGTELIATIKYNESSTENTSTTSIVDLMEKCAHTYSGTFEYKNDKKVMLTDDNAYIEIIMSPLQHDIDLKFNGSATPQNFTMENGSVWIAVDDNTTFTTNFTAEKTCTAGKITTINRVGFVDLGISGILWADKNIGADEVYGYGNYYAWGEVEPKTDYSWDSYKYGRAKEGEETHAMFNKYCPTSKTDYWYGDGTPDGKTTLETSDDAATVTNNKWSTPTSDEFKTLKNSCEWVWVSNYNGSVSGCVVYKTKSGESPLYSVEKDTHIFLPAAGNYYEESGSLESVGSKGVYWSSSLQTGNPDYTIVLNFGDEYVNIPISSLRFRGQSVRAVRR